MFVAEHEAFDDDAAAFVHGHGEGRLYFAPSHQVRKHTAAVIAVGWLHDDRPAYILRGLPGLFDAIHQPPLGDGHTASFQQALGQVLVAGNAFSNGAGTVCLRRPDAPLPGAVAQLNQIGFAKTNGWDVPIVGGFDYAGGAGPQTQGFGQVAQFVDRGLDIEFPVFNSRHDEVARRVQRGARNRFVPGADYDLVHAAHGGLAGPPQTARHAGKVLQLERDVFQDMARPGALAQALQETAALPYAAAVLDQRGQPRHQALVEAWNNVGRIVFQLAYIHPCLDDRPVCPDIGPAQHHHVDELDVFLLHLRWE